MDMLRRAISHLDKRMRKNASSIISYHVIGESSVLSVPATVSDCVFTSTNLNDVSIHVHATDFIVSVADFGSVEPKRGDVIVLDGYAYEVLAPNNEPVYRWSDPYHTILRIHAKFKGVYNG